MHNITDLGDFGYVPATASTSNNSLSDLLKAIIIILLIGGGLFLLYHLFFKSNTTSNRLASEIRKSLENSESVLDVKE